MRSLIITFFLVITQIGFSQKDTISDHAFFTGTISDFETGIPLEDFGIMVILDTDIIYAMEFEKTMNFELKLPYGFDFTIVFHRKGYVSRKVYVDISDIPISTNFVHEISYDLGLLEKKKGVKTKDLSKMISGIARFSPTKNKIEWFSEQKDRIDNIIQKRLNENDL